MENFNPFSAEYEPRISTGQLEAMAASVNDLTNQVKNIAAEVAEERARQQADHKQLLSRVEGVVSQFEANARTILIALKQEVSDEIKAQVNNANSTE